jgi:HD-like signal output (HDOD) protein
VSDGEERRAEPRVVIPLGSLPALPAPLAGLLRAANNPSATSNDLREAVAATPGFAERVLRVLAATAPDPARVSTIDDALREVGTRGVRGAVSALALAPLFDPAHADAVDPTRIALHSLTTALWLAETARVVRQRVPAAAFTAALMHDVGIVLLDRFAPGPYRELLARAEREGRHPTELEAQLLGTTHARVGGLLCAKWQLPHEITDLVTAHHARERCAGADLALLVVADCLAARHGAPAFAWAPPRSLPPGALELLGLDEARLEALGDLAASIQEQAAAVRRAAVD